MSAPRSPTETKVAIALETRHAIAHRGSKTNEVLMKLRPTYQINEGEITIGPADNKELFELLKKKVSKLIENVLALAHEHGFKGRTPGEAVEQAVAADSEATVAFLSVLADRIAFGLAAVVAVLDPPLVVLAGQVGRAGGPALCDAVARAMETAAPLQTTMASTTVDDDPVLIGALDTGLTAVREALIASVHAP